MYTAITPQLTNAQAWLAAAAAVQDAGGEAYNVVIDIADPIAVVGPDEAILTEVDHFLRTHHVNTLAGVANTIFPQGLLDRHGPDGLYAAYNDRVLPRMKQMPEFWGEVQPPASLKGLDIPSRRAVFVPWKPSRRPAFGMGNPTFSLRNQCCRRGCTSRRNPPSALAFTEKQRSVPSLHLHLFAYVPTPTCRDRHAAPLSSQPALGPPNDRDARTKWPHSASTRCRQKHPNPGCSGRPAHPRLAQGQPVIITVPRY